jgi:hypothetical protein
MVQTKTPPYLITKIGPMKNYKRRQKRVIHKKIRENQAPIFVIAGSY